LDDPAASEDTEPRGINNEGEIAGGYLDADDNEHAFLLSGGQYTTIDPPNSSGLGAEADGVNARGQIVGGYLDTNFNVHGYLLSGGQYTNLDDPNAVNGTFAYRINASGQIVGFYSGANFSRHGFLLSSGQYTTLDDPNGGSGRGQGTTVLGINDAGSVVGIFTDSTHHQHAFLATPTNGSWVWAAADTNIANSGSGENTSAPGALHPNTSPPPGPPSGLAGGDGSGARATGDDATGAIVPSTPAGMQFAPVSTDGGSAERPALTVLGEGGIRFRLVDCGVLTTTLAAHSARRLGISERRS
jgi:probable HAF family extracellular repeat protein